MSLTLGGLALAHPVLTAAGCGGTGRELAAHTDLGTLAAFTTRGIALDARPGAAPGRVVPTPSGLLAATGWPGPGVRGFAATELPWLAQQGMTTVVSVVGSSVGEYAEVARALASGSGVAGMELDLAGRNRERDHAPFGETAWHVGKVVAAVREAVPPGTTLLAKLTPGPGLPDRARAASVAGADAVVLVHGPPGAAYDPGTGRPALGEGVGELCGPAVLPLTLQAVAEVHAFLPDLPLVGVGGVSSGRDAAALLRAGATAVQVGSALLADPAAVGRVAAELQHVREEHHAASHPPGRETP